MSQATVQYRTVVGLPSWPFFFSTEPVCFVLRATRVPLEKRRTEDTSTNNLPQMWLGRDITRFRSVRRLAGISRNFAHESHLLRNVGMYCTRHRHHFTVLEERCSVLVSSFSAAYLLTHEQATSPASNRRSPSPWPYTTSCVLLSSPETLGSSSSWRPPPSPLNAITQRAYNCMYTCTGELLLPMFVLRNLQREGLRPRGRQQPRQPYWPHRTGGYSQGGIRGRAYGRAGERAVNCLKF